jgi:hypothetical protein
MDHVENIEQYSMNCAIRQLERFQAKWIPVRVKKRVKTKSWSPVPIRSERGSNSDFATYQVDRNCPARVPICAANPTGVGSSKAEIVELS